MRRITSVLLALFFVGCSHNSDVAARYHEDGRAKPITSIVAMIDTTSFDVPWSISDELTSMIVSEVGKSGKIFVLQKEDDVFTENPFGQDLSWVKREFTDREFAVFMELVEHEITPVASSKKETPLQELSSNLQIAVRLRVIDIRGETPKIVLQEMVRSSYFIPKTMIPVNYNSTTWGSPEFSKSPMGVAHAQVVQEIASRVTDYILLAKSR